MDAASLTDVLDVQDARQGVSDDDGARVDARCVCCCCSRWLGRTLGVSDRCLSCYLVLKDKFGKLSKSLNQFLA